MKSLIILAVVLFSIPGFAQDNAAPCRTDIAKFCSGMTERKKIVACLRKNSKNLSPSCTAKFTEARAALKDCKADMKKLCKAAGKDNGLVLKCLKENVDKLAPSCKSHFGAK